MPHYKALLTSTGPLRTGAAHGFTFSVRGTSIDVVARTLIEYGRSGWDYRGLRLIIDFDASGFEEALELAVMAADTLLSILSLAAAAEAPRVEVRSLLEDRGSEAVLVAFSYQELSELKMHKAYWSHLEQMMTSIGRLGESEKQRVFRALHWYRRGIGEVDPVDRFAALWIGLETLNPLLERAWGLSLEAQHCKECGASQGKRSGVYGAEKLIREIPEGGAGEDRRIKRLRNGLLHSYRTISESREDARDAMALMERAIPRALARLFQWPEDKENSLARSPVPPSPPYRAYARIPLTRPKGAPLGLDGFVPYAELLIDEHVAHDDRGEPEGFRYAADVKVYINSAVEILHDRATAAVTTRERFSWGAEVRNITIVRDLPPLPTERGKGVALWEASEETVWRPGEQPFGSSHA